MGIALVWIVLFVGDLVSEAGGEEADDEAARIPGAEMRHTSLWRPRHSQVEIF